MTTLTMGGNAPLSGLAFEVHVRWKQSNAAIDEIDVAAFILTASGKVSSDDDMIFYGQRQDGAGAIRMTEIARSTEGGGSETSLEFDLRKLPAKAEKIAVSATIPEAQAKKLSFSGVSSLVISVVQGGTTSLTFDVPVTGMSEAALILGEFYKRNDQWKFRAVGQGYNGGLKPLAEGFGVKVDDDPAPAIPKAGTSSVPAVPKSAPSVPSITPQPSKSPVNLSKVTLTKAAPKISLAKKGSGFGEIRINLNWNKRVKRSGFFTGGSKNVDLDIGCLWEMKDGNKGVVQALGNAFGDFDSMPYTRLMADDRTGASTDGEWLRINGARWSEIQRLMVYTFIYEGAANWTETDGVVTVFVPDNAPIEVKLDEGVSTARNCAIVLIENVGGELSVKREVKYFRDTQEIDKNYGWGLRWVAGRK